MISQAFAYATRHLGFAGANPVQLLERYERPHGESKPKRILGAAELRELLLATEPGYGWRCGSWPRRACDSPNCSDWPGATSTSTAEQVEITYQLDPHTSARAKLKTARSRRPITITRNSPRSSQDATQGRTQTRVRVLPPRRQPVRPEADRARRRARRETRRTRRRQERQHRDRARADAARPPPHSRIGADRRRLGRRIGQPQTRTREQRDHLQTYTHEFEPPAVSPSSAAASPRSMEALWKRQSAARRNKPTRPHPRKSSICRQSATRRSRAQQPPITPG